MSMFVFTFCLFGFLRDLQPKSQGCPWRRRKQTWTPSFECPGEISHRSSLTPVRTKRNSPCCSVIRAGTRTACQGRQVLTSYCALQLQTPRTICSSQPRECCEGSVGRRALPFLRSDTLPVFTYHLIQDVCMCAGEWGGFSWLNPIQVPGF